MQRRLPVQLARILAWHGAKAAAATRHAPWRPSSPLFGWAIVLGVCALALATCVASTRDTAALCVAAAIELVAGIVLVAHVVRIGYLVFETRGNGHYAFSAWRIIDAVCGNALAHVCFSLSLWTLGAARGSHAIYSHTGDVSAWYALYDITIYSIVFWSGGGVTDSVALTEEARALHAVQWLWQAIATIIFFGTAVSTLATHTDETPETHAPGAVDRATGE